jgi:protein-disulfide isomerase
MDDSDLTSAAVPALRPDDHVREGAPDRPLIAMYGDFSCPRCAPQALALRDEGARVVFRHFAIRSRHPRALPAAHAAEAAALQGAFWAFHDALFEDQGRLDDPHLWARCERLGLDVARFERDRRSDEVAERVRRDVRDALRAGLTSTPAVVPLSID